jgi:hypothetical protein
MGPVKRSPRVEPDVPNPVFPLSDGIQLSVKDDGPHSPVEAPPVASPFRDKSFKPTKSLLVPTSFTGPAPEDIPNKLSSTIELSVLDRDDVPTAEEAGKVFDVGRAVPAKEVRRFENACTSGCC